MAERIEFETQIRVRYQETDQMGVAYHGNYLTWFEVARCEMLDQLNVSYLGLEQKGFMLPVIEANVKYQKPCYFDDRLKLLAIIKSPPRIKIRVDYELYRLDEKICEGYTLHAFINSDTRKVCKPPQEFSDAIAALF